MHYKTSFIFLSVLINIIYQQKQRLRPKQFTHTIHYYYYYYY